ncbi:hypothetical protein ACOMHN_002042 [Nucella lapillus]
MKIVLFLTFVAVGQCALLGREKCTYGPSYWCSHVDHARECNTMQHCMSTAWKNEFQGLTGAVEGCSDVIKIVDDVRHAGAADPLAKMAKSCTKMPTEKRSVCKDLMMKNQNEVLLLLQSDLPSINVASALGLCGSLSKSAQQQEEHKQAEKKLGDPCTDCLNFFRDIQEMLNNTEEKIAEKLKKGICVKLDYFEKLCNETVDTYLGFFASFLEQQLNPQDVCFFFQFCPNATQADFTSRMKYMAAKLQLNTLECNTCQDLAKDLQNVLSQKALQNEIISELESKVCPLLPGDLATQCKTYVAEYGYVAFQVLIAELDPASICQKLSFCNATEAGKKLTVVPLVKALTTVQLKIQEPQNQPQSLPVCALCEYVIEHLEGLITTNATEEEIVAALDKVCRLMPMSYAAECDAFVKQYGREIVHFLLNGAPEGVCSLLGLCGLDQPVHVEQPVPVEGQECQMCKLIAGYARDFLSDPNTEITLESFLDTVCNLLPTSFRGECGNFMKTIGTEFIDALYQFDDPEWLCSEIKLCSGSRKVDSKKTDPAAKPLTFMPMAELKPAARRVSCDQGPEVWCASMDNARLCNAVQYCAENKKMKVDG